MIAGSPDARIVAPNGGEIIADTPDRRLEILCEHDAVHATWTRMGPGRDGADLHVHRHHHDVFYVLEGTLTVRLRDAELAVPPGMLACVPPLVVHGFRNASADTELRYLNFHAPGMGFADYLRGRRDGVPVTYDQHDPPPDGGADPAAVIVDSRLDLPHLTVACEASTEIPRADNPARRVECVYVLEGELMVSGSVLPVGTWITFLNRLSHDAGTVGRVVRLSAQI